MLLVVLEGLKLPLTSGAVCKYSNPNALFIFVFANSGLLIAFFHSASVKTILFGLFFATASESLIAFLRCKDIALLLFAPTNKPTPPDIIENMVIVFSMSSLSMSPTKDSIPTTAVPVAAPVAA